MVAESRAVAVRAHDTARSPMKAFGPIRDVYPLAHMAEWLAPDAVLACFEILSPGLGPEGWVLAGCGNSDGLGVAARLLV